MKLKLIGKIFGELTVIDFSGLDAKNRSLWECSCSCGNTTILRSDALQKSSSCGHLKGNHKHGHKPRHASPEYNAWAGMIRRCSKPHHKSWANYGGRGIRVCGSWVESFENFLADVGLRPSEKHSLDRINNDGNYEPTNCRWATASEQMKNRRKRVAIQNFLDAEIKAEFIRRGLKLD